jgi:hypothetical protein
VNSTDRLLFEKRHSFAFAPSRESLRFMIDAVKREQAAYAFDSPLYSVIAGHWPLTEAKISSLAQASYDRSILVGQLEIKWDILFLSPRPFQPMPNAPPDTDQLFDITQPDTTDPVHCRRTSKGEVFVQPTDELLPPFRHHSQRSHHDELNPFLVSLNAFDKFCTLLEERPLEDLPRSTQESYCLLFELAELLLRALGPIEGGTKDDGSGRDL